MEHILVRCRVLTALVLVCGLLAIVGGCGPSGPERIAVSGVVTYQGKPVPGGTIYFAPCAGTQGMPVVAAIIDGQYAAKKDGGLLVGDYQVRIESYRERTGQSAGGKPGRPIGPREQYLPAKYNTNTELKLTVPSGAGSITQNYDLGS